MPHLAYRFKANTNHGQSDVGNNFYETLQCSCKWCWFTAYIAVWSIEAGAVVVMTGVRGDTADNWTDVSSVASYTLVWGRPSVILYTAPLLPHSQQQPNLPPWSNIIPLQRKKLFIYSRKEWPEQWKNQQLRRMNWPQSLRPERFYLLYEKNYLRRERILPLSRKIFTEVSKIFYLWQRKNLPL